MTTFPLALWSRSWLLFPPLKLPFPSGPLVKVVFAVSSSQTAISQCPLGQDHDCCFLLSNYHFPMAPWSRSCLLFPTLKLPVPHGPLVKVMFAVSYSQITISPWPLGQGHVCCFLLSNYHFPMAPWSRSCLLFPSLNILPLWSTSRVFNPFIIFFPFSN